MGTRLNKISYQPPEILRPFIDRFWTCEGISAACSSPIFAAGTGAEMIFQLKAPMTIISEDNAKLTPPPQALYCIRTRHYKANINHAHRFIGIRFKAGAIRHFCPIPVADVIEQFWDLNVLYGDEGQRLTTQLHKAANLSQQLKHISDFLIELLKEHYQPQIMVDEAVRQLYYNREIPDLKAFSASLGTSYRQFERLFLNHMGVTPKAFQQTARLNNTLKHLLSHQIKDYLSVAFDYGYYDQSHFIRACRRYFGDKPGTILSPANQELHFYLSSFSASTSTDRK